MTLKNGGEAGQYQSGKNHMEGNGKARSYFGGYKLWAQPFS
jgi:hypothetical protein